MKYASRKTVPNPRNNTDFYITINKKNNNVLIYAIYSQKAQRLFKKIKNRKKKITLDNGISNILTHYQNID